MLSRSIIPREPYLMTQASLYQTLMDGHYLPDMWWEDGKCPDLTWRYRVKHWKKSQRRELARQYAILLQDLRSLDETWVGQHSEATASLIMSLSPTRSKNLSAAA
ncbi:hypothetical protein ASG25_10685 [Rhizobium sp. Leaf384]|nr:hypothetical protein ASG25_10685 [Rhizobium sp. Leaf384]